jgi:hypothetical protein
MRVLRKSAGKLKARTSILVLDETGAEIVCPRCGEDIRLPLTIGPELRKALEIEAEPPQTRPRLVLLESKDLDRLKTDP